MKRILMLVNWMVPTVSDDVRYSFFKNWPEDDIEVHVMGTSSALWIHRLEKRLRFHVLQTLKAWPRSGQYDLVVGYGCQSALLFALCKVLSRKRKPTLIVLDVEGLPRFAHGLARRLLSWVSGGINGIVAFSSSYASRYSEISDGLAGRSTFIPYGLDFSVIPDSLNCPKSDYIVALGYQDERFRDWKTLIAAYRGIQHRVRLVIIGRASLEGIDLGGEVVPGTVEFLPYLPPIQLAEFVAPALFAVIPVPERRMSLAQGTVLTLMGLKKAVIASDVEGLRDYIRDNETGRLYPCADAESLLSVMREWLDHPDRVERIESAAYESARTEYCEPLMAKRLHSFIVHLGVERA